jgi:hypothetical protein
MLNKAPIFLNGFSYGGTNLIMNMIVSHPDVSMLSGETHEVFRSKPRKKLDKLLRRTFYLPVQITTGQDVFGNKYFEDRKPISQLLKRYVDLYFYMDKLTNERNEFKEEGVRYTKQELKGTRFFAKNVNGVVLSSGVLSDIYPDASFIAIVRNGLALCEGYVRRGWSANEFGEIYEKVCEKMIEQSRELDNYHIVKFEDMVSDPIFFMKSIYEYSRLDMSKISKVRLQAKRSTDKEGVRKYTFGGVKDRETHWFDIEDIKEFIRPDVNDNQIAQLSHEEKNQFLERAYGSMKELGYIDSL